MDMRDKLAAVEARLPDLLLDESGWQSKLIDYYPPKVERLWRQDGDYRIALHRTHPCKEGSSLWHPHSWPAAMRLIEGTYEMGVGFGDNPSPSALGAKVFLAAGSSYEMTHPHGWHYVRPVGQECYSVMVTGPLFPFPLEPPSTKDYPFPELEPEVIAEMLAVFRQHYKG